MDCSNSDDLSNCVILGSELSSNYIPSLKCQGEKKTSNVYLFNGKKRSRFENAKFRGVGLVSISGPAPSLENVSFYDHDEALIVANNRAVKNCTIRGLRAENIKNSGIRLINNDHSSVVKNSIFKNVDESIVWREFKPGEGDLPKARGKWSPLYFCSAERIIKIKAGEHGYWFDYLWLQHSLYQGCSVIFEAHEEDVLHISANYTNYVKGEIFIKVFEEETNALIASLDRKRKSFKIVSTTRRIKIQLFLDVFQKIDLRMAVHAIKKPRNYFSLILHI